MLPYCVGPDCGCGSRSEFGSRTGHYGKILFSRNMFPHIFPCRLTGAFNTFPKGPSDQLPYASINMSSSCKGCHLKHVPEGSVVTIWYILGTERRYVGTSVALPYTYMDSLSSYLDFLDSPAINAELPNPQSSTQTPTASLPYHEW